MRTGIVAVCVLLGCGTDDSGPDRMEGVQIIRGDPGLTLWTDLTIEGSGLSVPDGTWVIVQVGTPERPPERLGYAETRVAGGAFSVHFPDIWEPGLYKKKVVLVDLDGDGACDRGELVFLDQRASAVDETIGLGDFEPATCAEVIADWPAA